MSDPLETLIEEAQAGNYQAASELVSRHYERIYAYLRRLCSHDQDAADLTQKTFCKAWTALVSYAGRSSFATWLHGIAHHVYVDWRRQHQPIELESEAWWADLAAPTSSPFDDAAERDLACYLWKLVEQLPDDTRQAVHLHYYQGLSLAETAQALEVATSTIKYRLREALQSLHSHVAELRAEAPGKQPR